MIFEEKYCFNNIFKFSKWSGETYIYLAWNGRNAFFTSEKHRNDILWSCQKVCENSHFSIWQFDNIYIKFGTKKAI